MGTRSGRCTCPCIGWQWRAFSTGDMTHEGLLGRCLMKGLVASIVALVITAVASPAMAYVAVVTTSIPLPNTADEAQIETALASAVNDVLAHAFAVSPTAAGPES